jgi:L-fucose isomerase-like protein
VYLWYEIIHPRFLRAHTDAVKLEGLGYDDVVVDSLDELTWRLRALCGLHNARGRRIVAIGGPAGWECPRAPELARERFKLDIRTVDYRELGELIREARADATAVRQAARRAAEYLADPGVTLETERKYVENAFVLETVFRRVLAEAQSTALTINECMGTIMPLAETSACLTLSLLNDAGYLAFCESDFVVIPSGILLWGIAGRPVFLNDPTYAHDHVITLAHCTGPRKLDGRTAEPARVLTHFESDYGAAPKVALRQGQAVTMIAPDFAAERYMGLIGEVADNPFLPICRTQVDVRYAADDQRVNAAMPGFHWMLAYGDYRRELGYALRRVGIRWDLVT